MDKEDEERIEIGSKFNQRNFKDQKKYQKKEEKYSHN